MELKLKVSDLVHDSDVEIYPFSRRMTMDLNLPSGFTPLISQQMQTQLGEFRALEAQEMTVEERVRTLRDVNNFESDPEGFARGLCKDLELEDSDVAPAIALSIREQLYEIANQNIATGRETCISKKVRAESGADFTQPGALGTSSVNLMRHPSTKISTVRIKSGRRGKKTHTAVVMFEFRLVAAWGVLMILSI
ncbi:hypothetical protein R1flu_002501 [Riccia fluitans]|uniref:Uncharacterized protein n=1 Tax=Riccia fluitans TaxID=41844 RepID=A0ABD1Y6A2_9MARC